MSVQFRTVIEKRENERPYAMLLPGSYSKILVTRATDMDRDAIPARCSAPKTACSERARRKPHLCTGDRSRRSLLPMPEKQIGRDRGDRFASLIFKPYRTKVLPTASWLQLLPNAAKLKANTQDIDLAR